MKREASILLLSDSGEGKTYQLGEVAVWYFQRSGGKLSKDGAIHGGNRTILYSSDFGDWSVIKPAVDLGIVKVVDLSVLDMPFYWLNKAATGCIPEAVIGSALAVPKWTPYNAVEVGPRPHLAYDSMTSMANLLMMDLARQAAAGANLGGGASYKFVQGDYTVSSNNQTHYNIVQNAILKGIADSQRATPGLVSWTARLRRAEEDGMVAVLGPQIAGKAMTPELPAWFTYTFRIAQEVMLGTVNKHVLYHEDHQDKTAPGAKVLANGRVPAGAKPIPSKQDPADVPKMLTLLMDTAYAEGMDALKVKLTAPLPGAIHL